MNHTTHQNHAFGCVFHILSLEKSIWSFEFAQAKYFKTKNMILWKNVWISCVFFIKERKEREQNTLSFEKNPPEIIVINTFLLECLLVVNNQQTSCIIIKECFTFGKHLVWTQATPLNSQLTSRTVTHT